MNYKIRLQELREYNNLSQAQLAELLNITKSTYNQYEQQYAIIPLKRLNDLVNIFNCSIDHILGFNLKKDYNNYSLYINLLEAGLRFKLFRKKRKLTQMKLAEKINIANSLISDFEKGKSLISTHALYDICKKYNISADYLLGKIDYIPEWCGKNFKS